MLSAAGSFLVRLLWPERCAACLVGIPETEVFCGDCEVTVLPLEAACPGCAVPQATCPELCQACRLRPFPFRQAMAGLLYGGAVADALVRFKHGTELWPARPLGRCLVPLLDWGAFHQVDAVVPVPLHPARLRARGFNQTLELLREASAHRAARLPTRRLPIWTAALSRIRDTPPLGKEAPPVRRVRLAGAFVADPALVRGRRLLVVDDVMTSGATLAECARTLLDAGAEDVLVGALARAVRA
jgi:predicted amidophosphoribosyltransferase